LLNKIFYYFPATLSFKVFEALNLGAIFAAT